MQYLASLGNNHDSFFLSSFCSTRARAILAGILARASFFELFAYDYREQTVFSNIVVSFSEKRQQCTDIGKPVPG